MRAFLQLIGTVSRIAGVAAALMLLLAVLVVGEMVLERYALNRSVYWQTELVTYLLIGATLLGSPYVLARRGHVRVDVLPLALGRGPRKLLAILADVAGLAFCAIITFYGYEYWHLAWSERWDSGTMWAVPLWIPLLALPVGMGLLSLQYVAQLIAVLGGADEPYPTSGADEERGP